ncbi:hypothetical protein BDF21DRAFT_432195 [Thamnidium elegans]|nr:hypothetical protein BDF21DRAFT_432195 [Thamnidium elegans]
MLEDYPEFIIKQRTNYDGERQYYVKWSGYDETDNTWESEQKLLAEWPFVLKEYKRNNVQTEPTNNYNTDTEAVFKYTSSVIDWESNVDCIVYVEKSKLSGLVVYVKWKNGINSVHHSSEVYYKCPQKMLDYFEQYRKFKPIHK